MTNKSRSGEFSLPRVCVMFHHFATQFHLSLEARINWKKPLWRVNHLCIEFISDVCCLLIYCLSASTVTPGCDRSYRGGSKGLGKGRWRCQDRERTIQKH